MTTTVRGGQPTLAPPKINVDLLRRVVEQIREHPETWDQRDWRLQKSCGTTYCMAGWAVTLAYGPGWWENKGWGVYDQAMSLLGLDGDQADMLFESNAGDGNVDEFIRLVTEVTGVTFDA